MRYATRQVREGWRRGSMRRGCEVARLRSALKQLQVERSPYQLQLDDASKLYIANAGPIIGGGFEVGEKTSDRGNVDGGLAAVAMAAAARGHDDALFIATCSANTRHRDRCCRLLARSLTLTTSKRRSRCPTLAIACAANRSSCSSSAFSSQQQRLGSRRGFGLQCRRRRVRATKCATSGASFMATTPT